MSRQIQLAAYPDDAICADHFRVVDVDTPAPAPGEVLVRNLWTSVDPGMRLRLAEAGPAGYFAPFPLNAPLDGIMTVGEVVETRVDGFAPGDIVWHAAGWREFAVVRAGEPALRGLGTLTKLDCSIAPPQAYLGPLGGVGLTAYAGLLHVAQLRGADIVWVSAAAGAVGSLVAQIAKLRGHRVIGSAGSAAKVAYLREELELDAAFDYHDAPVDEQLRNAAPAGIDVYFDNVGGDHLEAALAALRREGRAALCGAVSDYQGVPRGPRNLFQATANDLTLRGFRGSSHTHRFPALHRDMAQWLAEGLVKSRETVFDGLGRAPEALVRMLAGETSGKTLVRIN
jgi:NADPH-dependent curcumin reductase CurA